MRKIKRPPLDDDSMSTLAALSQRVGDSATTAKELWNNKPERAFGKIRITLEGMASGRQRCMYCEDSLATDIEHFWPKNHYPDRAFSWPNYLLACSHCNSNAKREQFPLDDQGQPLLVDPTAEDPALSIQLSPRDCRFEPVGPKGAETIQIFDLNDERRPRGLVQGRKDALKNLYLLLRSYDDDVRIDTTEADETRGMILRQHFSTVLFWLIRSASMPGATLVRIPPDIIDIIERHRIAEWILDD